MFSKLLSKIRNKLAFIQLTFLGLLTGGGLAATVAILANNLDTIPIVAGVSVNHNETLVADDCSTG